MSIFKKNSMRRWKKSFRTPPQTSYHPSTEYKVVFETLLISTFILIAIITILLFVSYFVVNNTYVIGRILLCAISLLYLTITYIVWAKNFPSLASKLLILFYFLIAGLVLFMWGLNTPFGLLLLTITIVLAGILLGARYTLYITIMEIIMIFGIQLAFSTGHQPELLTTVRPTHFGDAIAYSALLSILALISWLFGRQTERLLFKNKLAEQALIKEKELLEIRVEERTRELQKAQLKEMQQLYQFAEMGQLSAALLHDLANHLAVLTFDIADIGKNQHTQAIKRAEESIVYLEQAVAQVRKQLQGKSDYQKFDVVACIEDCIKIITPKAKRARATISLDTPTKQLLLKGDPLRLNHIASILIRNGIEAYAANTPKDKRHVSVIITDDKEVVTIRVKDQGKGIPLERRSYLFTPLKSTKKDGLGIGLFIAKKIAETHFKGTLSLTNTTNYTEFILQLPKVHS